MCTWELLNIRAKAKVNSSWNICIKWYKSDTCAWNWIVLSDLSFIIVSWGNRSLYSYHDSYKQLYWHRNVVNVFFGEQRTWMDVNVAPIFVHRCFHSWEMCIEICISCCFISSVAMLVVFKVQVDIVDKTTNYDDYNWNYNSYNSKWQ